MLIKTIKLKSIEARRFIEFDGKPRPIRIDHNSQISQVINNAEKHLTIEFQYTASYQSIGIIKLEGTIECEEENKPDDNPETDENSEIEEQETETKNKEEKPKLLDGENDAKQLAKRWINTRKLPDQFASNIHTAIMHTCVPEAVGIAKDLGLPPPIPLPQVKLSSDPKKGQIQGGMEVA
jgi:hypothetical protein